MQKTLIISLCVCIVATFLAGCITSGQSESKLSAKELAIKKCEELCKEALAQGRDLSDGPCLSTGNPKWDIEGWVCDIAHSPRIPEIDNLKENQCPEWGVSAHSFVEFTPECEFIRAYEG